VCRVSPPFSLHHGHQPLFTLMNSLELFGGSCSFTKVAKRHGYDVFATDRTAFEHIDHACDIFKLDLDVIPFIPNIIWASPPCTTFSVASIGRHWKGGNKAYIPKTDAAVNGMNMVKRTMDIIDHYMNINPDMKWIVENPRGILRKLDLIPSKYINTVWYCQYGDERAKPTDIWTNINWVPRPVCKNGNPDCHHQPAPRGSHTGTQGQKDPYVRSIVPPDLCKELLNNV